MRRKRVYLRIHRSHTVTLLLSSCACFLAATVIVFPEAAFEASLQGLAIWWEVLLPAQLPFFVLSELLLGLGVVHFLGVLFEPLMRPLFRVPGSGSFVLAVGLTSGNPMGAKLTSRLREQGLISRTEGERLVSFSSTAGPLFMFGTVAVGFFHNAAVGIILAAIHYASNFMVGILMRFHEPHSPSSPSIESGQGFLLTRALRAMHRARLRDGRALGQLLSDAVISSIQTCLMIGGFLVFFSVTLRVLSIVHVTEPLAAGLGRLLAHIGWPASLGEGVVHGLLEITLGAKTIAEAGGHPSLIFQLAVLNAVIAWSGLSIHAQVASLLSQTDIRYLPYMMARILHAALSFVLTLLLWDLLEQHVLGWLSMPVFFPITHASPWVQWWMFWAATTGILLTLLLFLGGCAWAIHRVRGNRP